MEKKILDFSAGLNVDKDKSRVLTNEFVNDSYNAIPQVDGSAEKRSGKDRNWKVDSSPGNTSGLIQNETEDGVKELFTIVNGKLCRKTDETISEELITGLTQEPFYSEYWQNQSFWGNGVEDIISKKNRLISRKLFTIEASLYRVQIFEKLTGHKFLHKFGSNGSMDGKFSTLQGITSDSSAMYTAEGDVSGQKRVQVFDKNGVFLRKFNVAPRSYDIAVDSLYIYVCGLESPSATVVIHNKNTGAIVNSSTYSTGFDCLSVDDKYIYLCRATITLKVWDKVTLAEVSSHSLSHSQNAADIHVDRDELDNPYAYLTVNGDDHVYIYNKYTWSLITSFGGSGTGDGEFDSPNGVYADNKYLYVVDQQNHRVQIFDKSDWSFVSKFGVNGTLGGQFNSPLRIWGDFIPEPEEKYTMGFLDAPAQPVAHLDTISGSLTAGTFQYKVTFTDGTNETNASIESNDVVIAGGNTGKIWLQIFDIAIPDNITHWVIYRSKDGGSFHQIDTVLIATKEYLDNNSQASVSKNTSFIGKSTIYPFLDSNIFTFFRESLWIIEGKFLYFSAPFQPYYFPSTNSIELDTRTDGNAIYGGEAGMYIFTKNSISLLEGWTIENFFLRELSDSVGCISHRSCQEYLKTLIFLDRNGIFVTTGGDPIKISDKRIDTLIKSIRINKRKYINSVIYDDKYILNVAIGDNDYCDTSIVYDFKLKCFYILKDWILQDMALIEDDDDNLLLYGSSNDSGVYELFVGTSDIDIDENDNDISMALETKHFDEQEPLFLKLVKNVTAYAQKIGVPNSTFTFKWKVGENAVESKEITLSDGLKHAKQFRPLSGRGTKFYFRIEESSQNEFNIFGFSTDIELLSKMDVNK